MTPHALWPLAFALSLLAAEPPVQYRFDPAHTGQVDAPTQVPGALAWRVALGGRVRGTPAVAGDVVVVGGESGRLAAFRLGDGIRLWALETGTDLSASPAIAGDLVLVPGRDGRLRALELATGKPRWEQALGADLPFGRDPRQWDLWVSSPCVVDEQVLVGGGGGGLHAFDLRTGRPLWRFATKGRVRSSPAVAGGRAFVGSLDGVLYAVALADGSLAWTHDTGGPIQSSPAVAEGRVFVGSRAATVTALAADRGTLLWKASHPNGSWVLGAPAVAGGKVFIGSSDEQFLQALDAATGAELWRLPARGRVLGAPTCAGRAVLFTTEGANLFSADQATGLLLGSTFTEGGMVGGVVPAGNLLLAGSDDGHLYAFQARVVADAPLATAAPGLAGTYRLPGGYPLVLRERAGRLEALIASQPPAALLQTPEGLACPALGLTFRPEPAGSDQGPALVATVGTRTLRFPKDPAQPRPGHVTHPTELP